MFDILCFFLESLLRAWMSWNNASGWSLVGHIHQIIIDQPIDQWRVRLNACVHVSTPKESILNTCYDVLLHNCQQLFVVSFETYFTVLLQHFIRVLTFKVLTAFH